MKDLRDYQVADLAFYMATPRCGNLSDPGTGKTPSVCVCMWWLWSEERGRTVWAMPKSLLHKNRKELLEFSEFKPEDIVIVQGTKAKRLKQMQTDAKVFLTTFTEFCSEWDILKSLHPDLRMMVGDEWHMGFKTDASQRSQSLYRFFDDPDHRLIAMTGTLLDGRLDTCFPFIHVCNPSAYPGGHLGFVMHHGIEDEYGRVVAWHRPEKLRQELYKFAIRHTFEEVYGPEAKVMVHELVQMDPKQREFYAEFEETALLELENSWLDGTLPGVNMIRCRQLMEHPQSFGDPLDQIKLTGKEEQLLIHLEDHKRTGKPLLIFGALTPQHDRVAEICRKEGFRVGLINGRVSQAERNRIDEQFRAGTLDIVVASAATAGLGFNWGHVDHVIFMSLDYLDSSFVQAYRRAIRGVRERPLLITVMEYEDSMDQHIFKVVEKKSALGQSIDGRERLQLRA